MQEPAERSGAPSGPRRSLTWVFAFASAALFLPLCVPLLTGRMFVYTDLRQFHIPLRYLYQNALRAGDSVLWTPAIMSGFYLHGEGQVGMFHPFHFAIFRWLPLWVAMNVELLANYAAAFAGMFWLLRRFAFDVPFALAGALLFGFCGFSLLHHLHLNLVAVVAHIPWLLASADLLLTSETPRGRALGYAGVALVMASELLLGFPQGVWWNLLTLGAFVLARTIGGVAWTRVVLLGAALATAGLLGAIQVLPTLDVSARSIRSLLPPGYNLTLSLHPWNLMQLWSPYVFNGRVYSPTDAPWPHELGIYTCALTIVVLPWLWIRRGDLGPRRPLVLAAAIFGAVTLVLAFGRYGGLDILRTYVPGLKDLRAPARYIVLVQFALAALTAVALENLARLPPGFRLTRRDVAILSIPAVLSVATNIALVYKPFPAFVAAHCSSPLRAAVGTALVVGVSGLFVLAVRRVGWALPALVALTVVDVALWGLRPLWRDPPATLAALAAPFPPPPDPIDQRYAYIEDYWPTLTNNELIVAGYRLTSGYVALYPATHFHMTSYVSKELSGTRWNFSTAGWKVPFPRGVPRARLLDQVRVTRHIARDLETVDLHHAALVATPVPPLTGPPGAARVLVDRPGHIVVETDAPGRQLLSVSERFHDGWVASAEGRSLETVAIFGDFLGCVVEPGVHRVEFEFRPRSFALGRLISIAAIPLLLLGAAWLGVRSGK